MRRSAEFRAANFAVARLSLLSDEQSAPQAPDDLENYEQSYAFLSRVAADPILQEAIAVSSSTLDATLTKVASGLPVEPKRLRGAVLSTVRYLSRMRHRPTPFGLMAGVVAVGVDNDVKVRIGPRHRTVVRPDMGWLTDVIRPWETDPKVAVHLRLVANDLCFVRGDRLVLAYVRAESDERGPDDREQTVRHTAAVQTAMAIAHAPIRHPALVGRLSAAFPDADKTIITRMLADLIERDFLLTDLRPPAAAGDPIGYVLERMAALPEHAGRMALVDVREALERYAVTPLGEGRAAWRHATSVMRRLNAHDRPIQVDLAMDADIALPRSVATELEQAATVAWRLAPLLPDPRAGLSDYRAAFVERYGTGVAVPVKEALDPETGIGAPAGYLMPPSHRHAPQQRPPAGQRDRLLGGLAQQAMLRRTHEVVLDDDLVERLTQRGEDPPSYIEACAQLFAESEDAIRAGNFHLVLTPVYFTRPGAMFGRFLHVVPDLRDSIGDLASESSGGADAIAAQVYAPTSHSRVGNIVAVPRLTEMTAQIGVFADRSRSDVLGIDDLAIGATHDRFFVVSTRTGQEVVPMPFHALNPATTLPNALRLLIEIGETQTPPWPLWSWGQTEHLPFLPRIRHGRTVLMSARWRPDERLTDAHPSLPEWTRIFDEWRSAWLIPEVVYAVRADQRIKVDLASSIGRRLLRDNLVKHPETIIEEVPLGGQTGAGWVGGHANEIVIPLRPSRRRKHLVPRPRTTLARITDSMVRSAFQPGGEWLFLKVYAGPGRHGELLTRHLPELLDNAAPITDHWFFVRYRDGDPHLRVRFHGEPAVLNTRLLPIVHQWAAQLVVAGVIREIVLDTYRPEITRYGGPEVIEAAERAFGADSVSVLEQLSMRAQRLLDLPLELLAAANHIDLSSRLHGDGWREWMLDTFPKNSAHASFQRHRRDAVRLLNPADGWSELNRIPGGGRLLDSWERRGAHIAAYGRLVRDLVARGRLDSVSKAFSSVLHMHHNRLVGIAPETERSSYAIARGAVQAQLDRERHSTR